MAKLCLVQGSPVYNDIGPYISILATDAKATVNSIFRGPAAQELLNAHGKHSQAQLYQGFIDREPGFLPANPPGFSTHELRSDGAAYPSVGRGDRLAWWQQGFDVNDSDVDRVIAQGHTHGWVLWRPYDSGSEFHHLNFRQRPGPGPRTIARIYRLRATLPRR
jgi:hypothetical protein